jgi:hypothetical protein
MPGTAAFDAEYQHAFRGELRVPSANQRTSAVPGTMRWLCAQYHASAAFQLLAPSTRKVRRVILEEICQRAGNFRFATVEAQHPQQAAVYTKKANRAKLEAEAARLLQAQSSNKSAPLFPAAASSGTIGPKSLEYQLC